MNTLNTEKLYILSAPPACGKSSFLKSLDLPEDAVLSSDEIRVRYFGEKKYGDYSDPRSLADQNVFDFMMSALDARMRNRMTTFIDATNIRETDRLAYAHIARKYHMPVEVLFFDKSLDQALIDNSNRKRLVPEKNIRSMFNGWVKQTELPHRTIQSYEAYTMNDIRKIPSGVQIDAIGDVHGLKRPLLALLQKLGYDTSKPSLPHPENRKLLFLGDMVDRGPESIETLELVMGAAKAGHYAIRGNHEQKILHFLHAFENDQLKKWNSVASAKTGYALISLDQARKKKIIDFLLSLPGYYYQGNTAFVHADIGFTFDPKTVTLNDCMYGESTMQEKKDSDTIFRQNNDTFSIVRGHIPSTSEGLGVKTVYKDGEYGGHLAALRLPDMSSYNPEETRQLLEEKSLILESSNFDYDEVIRSRSKLAKNLRKLVKDGLATATLDESSGLTLFKYSKQVFFDNLWDSSDVLNRARGIVLDLSDQIVQNPFTKVFNLNENGTTLPDDERVICPEKINGFMGSVSLHPCYPAKLLVTTTGSFKSDFVGYIYELIEKTKSSSAIIGTLKKAKAPLTLLFEVVHEKDPHIVDYTPQEQGLYLIGARGMGENDLELTEDELDEIAKNLNDSGGKIFRPKWFRMSFLEAKEWVKNVQNHEGLMIRRDSKHQEIVMKIKSPWYLTTKFIGRMGDGNIRHMFSNPKSFKQKIDEEFFQIVDAITSQCSENEFKALDGQSKISLVRDIIETSRVTTPARKIGI